MRESSGFLLDAAGAGCSAGAPVRRGEPMDEPQRPKPVHIPPLGLEGLLGVPDDAKGLVVFAHGGLQWDSRGDSRWTGAIPGSFLYDEEGRLRDFWEGAMNYEGFEQRVLPVLSPSRRGGS